MAAFERMAGGQRRPSGRVQTLLGAEPEVRAPLLRALGAAAMSAGISSASLQTSLMLLRRSPPFKTS